MKRRRIIEFSIFIFLPLFFLQGVVALEQGYCVEAEIADISPSSVEIGEEFTVGVHIENCGDELPKNVSFEIIRLPSDINVKEPLMIEIPKIRYANSERFITYHMKISNQAKSGMYVIKIRLSYEDREKEYNITINVIGDEAELSIASLKTEPVLPKKGDFVELTLRIENTGEGTAKSVEVYVNHSFQGLKQSFIGALDPDEDGPAVLTFIVDEAGEFEIPVKVSYKDDFGYNEVQTKINLTILKKKTNWFLIFFLIALVLFAFWGFRNYSKLKRTKNKIIHQLLSGETREETKEIEMPVEAHEEKKKRKRKQTLTDEEKKKKQKRIKEFKEEILKKHRK